MRGLENFKSIKAHIKALHPETLPKPKPKPEPLAQIIARASSPARSFSDTPLEPPAKTFILQDIQAWFKDKEKVVCPDNPKCDRSFEDIQHMAHHIMIDHNYEIIDILDKKTQCTLCDKSFTSNHLFRAHFHKTHGDQDPYVARVHCSHCPARFNNQRALQIHTKKVHPEHYAALKRMRVKERDEIRKKERDELLAAVPVADIKMTIGLDGSRSLTLVQLRKAILQAKNLGEKFMCPDCGKCFEARLENTFGLMNHLRTHDLTIIDPLAGQTYCKICGTQHTNNEGLRQHTRRIHGDDIPEIAKYECPECFGRFVREKTLEQHIHKVHGQGQSSGAHDRGMLALPSQESQEDSSSSLTNSRFVEILYL